MNDLLDIEIILKRKKYSKIYNMGIIMLALIIIFLGVANIYEYQSYLLIGGRGHNYELEMLVNMDELKFVVNNSDLMIDKNQYSYTVKQVDKQIYIGEDGNKYQYVYLKVDDLNINNNDVYQVKFLKEKKKLIEYIKEYF